MKRPPEAWVYGPQVSTRRRVAEFTPSVPDYLLTPEMVEAERARCALAGPLTPKQALARLGEYVAVRPQHEGPVSNTGLNLHPGDGDQTCAAPQAGAFGLCIDYCTLVFSASAAERCGQSTRSILQWLFGAEDRLKVTDLKRKQWQFYTHSAYIQDGEGNVVGRIGRGGNRDTWCVSLSGAGCAQVRNWPRVVIQAGYLDAHISRVDIAFDDYQGLIFGDIHKVNAMARSGEFASRSGMGKAPKTSFFDDHGASTGCTVYVGSKGRKQLCIYEKGKQLGDLQSPWIRCELRLWAADSVVPLDVLTRPHEFFRGAYDVLAERVPLCDEGARPERTARTVAAKAEAAKRFLSQQCGPMLHLMWEVLGGEYVQFMKEQVFRNTLPARFRGVAADKESLVAILRNELGYELAPPF